jgi:hypothetical protein
MDAENVTINVVDGVMTVRAPRVERLRSNPVEVTPARYRVNADSAAD